MWGTVGLIYNSKYVSDQQAQSWNVLRDPAYKGKVLMKDAFRDVYSVVVLYVYRDEIARGEVTRDELVANVTKERIARVEQYLNDIKYNVAGWEVDFGKEQMTKGQVWMNLSWSGDAQWAIEEAAEVGVDLQYLVPAEGSNVWFDGWCIPKYAKNTKAASYFINYMCMPENAILNMEEIGYVSVIAAPEILEWANDAESNPEPSNLSYFFGEGADSVHANPVFYPDQTIIERCALMHDCGDKTEDMIAMWSRVKGDNLTMGMVIFVCIILALIVVVFILQAINRKHQRDLQRKKRNRKR
jgi:spermidine/putrescine transport system substrate-binding protein